jgi:hypothetical protein
MLLCSCEMAIYKIARSMFIKFACRIKEIGRRKAILVWPESLTAF